MRFPLLPVPRGYRLVPPASTTSCPYLRHVLRDRVVRRGELWWLVAAVDASVVYVGHGGEKGGERPWSGVRLEAFFQGGIYVSVEWECTLAFFFSNVEEESLSFENVLHEAKCGTKAPWQFEVTIKDVAEQDVVARVCLQKSAYLFAMSRGM